MKIQIVLIAIAVSNLAHSANAKSIFSENERAVQVVSAYMDEFQKGSSESLLALLETPFFHDRKKVIDDFAELRSIIEGLVKEKGGRDLGKVTYKVVTAKSEIDGQFGRSYIDVIAKVGDEGVLFRVRPRNVYRIVGISD